MLIDLRRQQLLKLRLPHLQPLRAGVETIEPQQIEGVEYEPRGGGMLQCGEQKVIVGAAVRALNDYLAV